MKEVSLRNGMFVKIREAAKEDAQQMIDFYNVVFSKTILPKYLDNISYVIMNSKF
jgi:hypothetical protein